MTACAGCCGQLCDRKLQSSRFSVYNLPVLSIGKHAIGEGTRANRKFLVVKLPLQLRL